MKYILDTNVISEMIRTRPHANVMAWLQALPPQQTFYSAITIGELRKGVEQCQDSALKAGLEEWLQSLIRRLRDQILPVDSEVAERWGRLEAASPRTLPTADTLILATALTHGLSVLTRNLKDFDLPGVQAIDPWTAPAPH